MLRSIMLLAGFALAGPAAAEPFVYTVGADGPAECSTTSLQVAVDMARAHPGPDLIHLANNLTYTDQDVEITEGDETEIVQIVGGYASCKASNDFEAPQGRTTLSGAGGARAPVIAIKDGAAVSVELLKLHITKGDNYFGAGGGVAFDGRGYLTLADTVVAANAAGRGGGVYFEAHGGTAILQFKADTVITGNGAAGDGGGVFVTGPHDQQAKFWATEPRVTIKDNRAPDGRGGGLYVHGYTEIDLRSPGFGTPSTALFADNAAREGGALAVKAATEDAPSHAARVSMRSDSETGYVQLHGNTASLRGGAIAVYGDYDSPNIAYASVVVRDFLFTENSAPDGAVGYVADGGHSNELVLGTGTCRNYPCNRIERNTATGTNGSLLHVGGYGAIRSERVVVAYNTATHLARAFGIHSFDWNDGVSLANCAVVLNTFTGSMFQMDADEGTLFLYDCTIADNQIGGHVIEMLDASDRLQLKNSILSEQAPPLFTRSLDTVVETANNIVHSASVLGPYDRGSVVAPPNFLDRSYGDYRLKPGSRAVDFAPRGGSDFDLLFGRRERDFAIKVDADTPRDVGAIEYQPLSSELVMNNEFAGDLRAWEPVPVGAAASVVAQDALGALGADGSLQATLPADTPGGDHIVARQCIPLPLPGGFRLQGFADASTAADGALADRAAVRLLLRTGSSECSAAAPVVAMDEAVVPGGSGWKALAERGFEVNVPVQPNYTVSLELQLVVKRHPGRVGTNASVVRFDRLSLVPGSLPAGLFRDSFEN